MKQAEEKKKIFGRLHLEKHLTTEFLEGVKAKYHYEEKDAENLKKVASDIKICIKEQENFCLVYDGQTEGRCPQALVTLTLGSNLDILQERYHKKEQLLESYMLETISSELLCLGYEEIQGMIREITGMYVEKLSFFGEGEEYSLAQMAEQLKTQGITNVRCTLDYCLRPLKSVAYRAQLTGEKVVLGTICSQCKNRGNCRHGC